MNVKHLIFTGIIIAITFPLFAQEDTGGGLHFSYIANYNPFYLSVHKQVTFGSGLSIDEKVDYRKPENIPDEYLPMYRFGFINHNKKWHDFRFTFLYMPKTEHKYTEYKNQGQEWQTFNDNDEYVKVNMELYMLNLEHLIKINLIKHHFYLNLGVAGGGGLIRWPSFDDEGNDYYYLTYYAYPIGGIEILLGKHLGLHAEYHYQYGKSESQAISVNGGKNTWEYRLEGHELSAWLNIYF